MSVIFTTNAYSLFMSRCICNNGNPPFFTRHVTARIAGNNSVSVTARVLFVVLPPRQVQRPQRRRSYNTEKFILVLQRDKWTTTNYFVHFVTETMNTLDNRLFFIHSTAVDIIGDILALKTGMGRHSDYENL